MKIGFFVTAIWSLQLLPVYAQIGGGGGGGGGDFCSLPAVSTVGAAATNSPQYQWNYDSASTTIVDPSDGSPGSIATLDIVLSFDDQAGIGELDHFARYIKDAVSSALEAGDDTFDDFSDKISMPGHLVKSMTVREKVKCSSGQWVFEEGFIVASESFNTPQGASDSLSYTASSTGTITFDPVFVLIEPGGNTLQNSETVVADYTVTSSEIEARVIADMTLEVRPSSTSYAIDGQADVRVEYLGSDADGSAIDYIHIVTDHEESSPWYDCSITGFSESIDNTKTPNELTRKRLDVEEYRIEFPLDTSSPEARIWDFFAEEVTETNNFDVFIINHGIPNAAAELPIEVSDDRVVQSFDVAMADEPDYVQLSGTDRYFTTKLVHSVEGGAHVQRVSDSLAGYTTTTRTGSDPSDFDYDEENYERSILIRAEDDPNTTADDDDLGKAKFLTIIHAKDDPVFSYYYDEIMSTWTATLFPHEQNHLASHGPDAEAVAYEICEGAGTGRKYVEDIDGYIALEAQLFPNFAGTEVPALDDLHLPPLDAGKECNL